MSKVILTDVDDCLLDWAGPFQEWVLENYPQYQPKDHLRDHWHVEAWLGCTIEETRDMIRTFNATEEIWKGFDPLPLADEYVEKLHSEGWKFVAITACAEDTVTYDGRWENLQSVFGRAFDTLHCVGLHSSKAGILQRYRPTYWVEDKFKHAVAGADLGHVSFLINYKHNAKDHDERLIRVSNWQDIYNHIKYREENSFDIPSCPCF